jgi:hypothetical protein
MRIWLAAFAFAWIVSQGSQAADSTGFALWKASDLRQHDVELSKHVAADHSSRETLKDYGSHRFRMLYRDADGNPEQHDAIIDVVLVQSGAGTLVMGGTMVGKRSTNAGEWVGTRLDGGDRHPQLRHRLLCAGDPGAGAGRSACGPRPDQGFFCKIMN